MCSDETLQRYVFLKALGELDKSFTELELVKRMSKIANEELNDKMAAIYPHPLPTIFKLAADDGLAIQSLGSKIKITSEGKSWRNYLAKIYIKKPEVA